MSGWAAQWLLLYKRPYITDPAYSTTYELPIRRHILPALGHMLLVDVTPADILRFYQQASILSPSMCGKIRMCVNGIFRSACSNGLCTSNPADGCKLESMALPQIKEVYNDRQIEIASRWFLSRMPEVVLLLETGMRRGSWWGCIPRTLTDDAGFTECSAVSHGYRASRWSALPSVEAIASAPFPTGHCKP